MMIYFHCSDLHVTPPQRGRLGFGEGMFLFLPFAFLIQFNEMEIMCSMLKMMMLVSKERKSTRFFHSFFDLHSDITKQRRAWTEGQS